MELLYRSPIPSRARPNFLGITAAGFSIVLLSVPATAIAASAWIASSLNAHSFPRISLFLGWHLTDAHNITIMAVALLGLLAGAAGIIASRNRCLVSMTSALFNLVMLTCALLHA